MTDKHLKYFFKQPQKQMQLIKTQQVAASCPGVLRIYDDLEIMTMNDGGSGDGEDHDDSSELVFMMITMMSR